MSYEREGNTVLKTARRNGPRRFRTTMGGGEKKIVYDYCTVGLDLVIGSKHTIKGIEFTVVRKLKEGETPPFAAEVGEEEEGDAE